MLLDDMFVTYESGKKKDWKFNLKTNWNYLLAYDRVQSSSAFDTNHVSRIKSQTRKCTTATTKTKHRNNVLVELLLMFVCLPKNRCLAAHVL